MELVTPDLLLKSGSAEDHQALYRELWSCEEVFRFLFSRPCADEDAGRKKTAAYAEMHRTVPTEFFVYRRDTGEAAGIAGIKELSPGSWTVTDIAISPEIQGRGCGRQILTALLHLAFTELHAKELRYSCFAQNLVSKHLAESCGFVYTHTEETELPKTGGTVLLDHYLYRRQDT